MAATITIEIDDAGVASVSVDGQEPHTFSSTADAAEYITDLIGGEEESKEIEEPEGAESPESDEQAMWDEEASNRPANPNLMN